MTVAALESRLQNVLLNLRRAHLRSAYRKRQSAAELAKNLIVIELKDYGVMELLEGFWEIAGCYRKLKRTQLVALKGPGLLKWADAKAVLKQAIEARNKIAHGDLVGLVDQMKLDKPNATSFAVSLAKSAYNALVNVIAIVNFATRYSSGKNDLWKSVDDALNYYAHLRMP